MALSDERRLVAKVAHLYYQQRVRQPEIASQLDLSQATVSRLLKRALDEGIVRITVSTPPGVFSELEDAVQARYGLKEVIVVDASTDDDHLLPAMGAAAAYYAETTLKPGDIVGISSWSETLLSMVDAMHRVPQTLQAQVVQILGGMGNPAAEVHAASLTRRLAKLLHGEGTFLPVPGLAGSIESRRVLVDDPFVRAAFALFDKVTLALVGIGALEPSKLLASSGNVFAPEEIELLRANGAVGDICLHFFDRRGSPVHTPLDERVISMSLEQLQGVRRSVGIAGGRRKRAAIRGALAGRWINVLITDRLTAESLLCEPGDEDTEQAITASVA